MQTIQRSQFQGSTEQLTARLQAFRDEIEAHALTVGVPAPREEDWIEALARSADPFEMEPEPAPPPPDPTAEELAAAERVKARGALVAQIGAIEQSRASLRRLREIMTRLLPEGADRDYLAAVEAQIAPLRTELEAMNAPAGPSAQVVG